MRNTVITLVNYNHLILIIITDDKDKNQYYINSEKYIRKIVFHILLNLQIEDIYNKIFV